MSRITNIHNRIENALNSKTATILFIKRYDSAKIDCSLYIDSNSHNKLFSVKKEYNKLVLMYFIGFIVICSLFNFIYFTGLSFESFLNKFYIVIPELIVLIIFYFFVGRFSRLVIFDSKNEDEIKGFVKNSVLKRKFKFSGPNLESIIVDYSKQIIKSSFSDDFVISKDKINGFSTFEIHSVVFDSKSDNFFFFQRAKRKDGKFFLQLFGNIDPLIIFVYAISVILKQYMLINNDI